MKYMLAVFADHDARADQDFSGAWRAFHQAMIDAGVCVDGSALQHPSTATTVRLEAGRRMVQDGPFANTREQLGGYIIIDVPTLHDALEWAARCPAASYGTLEIRPLARTA
jgi:hypothetical protein